MLPLLRRLRTSARFLGRRVHLVVQRGAKLAGLVEALAPARSVTAAFLSVKDTFAVAGRLGDCREYAPDLVPGNSDAFEAVVRQADALSDAAIESFLAALGDSRIGALLRDYRYPMYLGLRASLINVLRMVRAAEAGAGLRHWDRLILACNTRDFLLTLAPALSAAHGASRIFGMVDGAIAPASEFRVPSASTAREPSAADAASFGAVLDVPVLTLPRRLESWVLFVIRSSLKTVPSTVLPLLTRLGRKAAVVIVDHSAGTTPFTGVKLGAADGEFLRRSAYLYDVAELRSGCRLADRAVVEAFVGHVCRALRDRGLLAWRGFDLEPAVAGILGRYLADGVPALALNIRAFERFFVANRNGVVVACPGRTAEAAAAQVAARRHGVPSIDVMNAYMSYGYTYAAPHGDYLSVIDAWSHDLCVSRYGIPAERVLVCGTPRFDRVPLPAGEDRQADATARNGARTVVLASQPEARKYVVDLINDLARLDAAKGTVNFVVKMHPTETDQDEAAYASAIAGAASRHSFEVVRARDIYEVLRGADAVIVLFSNVGVEAALMDLPVIVAKQGWDRLPLPLDEMGIGITACTGEELRNAVLGLLHDDGVRGQARALRREFMRKNPLLASRSSTDALVKVIEDMIGRQGTPEEPVAATGMRS